MPESHGHDILLTLVCAASGGVGLMALARRLKVPAIVLLLLAGVVLGPEVLGWVRADSLGGVLPVFVSMAVGIILFEGGITLDVAGYREAGTFIRRLISWGVLVTWVLGSAAVMLIADVPLPFALLAASLVTVTGPTVIMPLMKRIRVVPKLRHILSWEAVLIDPVGVFLAVLCFEAIVRQGGGAALAGFGLRIAVGLAVGVAGGLLLAWVMRRGMIPEDMSRVGVLGAAVLIYGTAELVVSESGLLSTVAGGLVVGAANPPGLREVRRFKAELTDLMIGVLFILLASRLKLAQFQEFGVAGFALVAVVVFVVRPVNVLVCAVGQGLSAREKAFLSWVAPRGIVAASMASLVRITLERRGMAETGLFGMLTSMMGLEVRLPAVAAAQFVETFVYSVIVVTIVLQGLSAGWVARLLGLRLPDPTGWLIVGAHRLAREVAGFVRDTAGVPVFLADTNDAAVKQAEHERLRAVHADARRPAPIEEFALGQIGRVAALTNNEDLNAVVCRQWRGVVGASALCRWSSGQGDPADEADVPGTVVWREVGKPAWVSDQLDWGRLRLRRASAETDPPGPGETVLATAGPQGVTLAPARAGGRPAPAGTTMLVIGPAPQEAPPETGTPVA